MKHDKATFIEIHCVSDDMLQKKVAIFRFIPAYSSQNTSIDKHCVLILGSSNVNFAVMQYLFLKVVTLWRIEISIIWSIFTLGWKFDSSSCQIVALSITQTDLAAQVEIRSLQNRKYDSWPPTTPRDLARKEFTNFAAKSQKYFLTRFSCCIYLGVILHITVLNACIRIEVTK